MKRFLRSLIMAVSVVTAMAFTIGFAAAAKPADNQSKPKHEEVISYWTPDRVGKAKPREVSPTGRPSQIDPQKPSGGGGGKGGTSITGSSWNGGGLVKKTVGKVLFTMGGADYVCSGTVVQDTRLTESLVLTAGHCIYDSVDGWATNWMFMPDFDSAPSQYSGGSFNCAILLYGCWTTDSLVTSAGWGAGNFNEDYGFAVINSEGHTALLEDVVGAQAISFTGVRPSSVYAFGYPQASPYNGSDLVYCSGSTIADTWGGSTDSGLKCNMTGGSSGGGWFSPFDASTGVGTLVSVNSFKYTAGPLSKHMFGPLFDGDTLNTYNAAQTAIANTLN